MPRAPRQCPKCDNIIYGQTRYCDQHQPPPWSGRTTGQGSTRATRKARETVLKRDKHTCQLRYPGCLGHATDAHHITSIAVQGIYRREATDTTAMIAVCRRCHDRITTSQHPRGTTLPPPP